MLEGSFEEVRAIAALPDPSSIEYDIVPRELDARLTDIVSIPSPPRDPRDEWDPEVLVDEARGPERFIGKLVTCGCGSPKDCQIGIHADRHDIPARVDDTDAMYGGKPAVYAGPWVIPIDLIVVHPEPGADAP